MNWRSRSVPPVWIAATVGAVLVGIFAGAAYLTWLPIVLAGCVLLTFTIQSALQRKEALVNRVIASIGGAVAIVALATAVLAVLHPTGLASA